MCITLTCDGQEGIDFKQSRSHFKILGAIRMTKSKFHTENPQILGATTQNLVIAVPRLPGSGTGFYALHKPTTVPRPSPFQSGTGSELSTASVALPPPTYCILFRPSPVGKLAVFFGNLFCVALINPLRGSGS